MKSRELNLLDDLEAAALDSSMPISDALRRAIALGGAVSSGPVRKWASRELTGYEDVDEDDVPSYRKLPALIQMDSISGYTVASHQTISPSSLPDFVKDKIKERVTLYFPIAEIEELAIRDEPIRLTLPMAADLARVLHTEWKLDPYQQITAIYWTMASTSMRGVVDRVRTSLTELVAEIRAGLTPDSDAPSAELANQALNIAIHGDARGVTVTQASGQTVLTIGDHNVVNTRFSEVVENLKELKKSLMTSSALSDDQKADVLVEVQSMTSQLRKTNPDPAVTKSLWRGIEKAANVAGLTQASVAIGAALERLL